MANAKKIIYLSEDDYATLWNNGAKNGSITKNGITYTYDENVDYRVPMDGYSEIGHTHSYSDLIDKPDLTAYSLANHGHSYSDIYDPPKIGSATLTIQRNGTTVGTFSANATSDKTINISDNNTTYAAGTGLSLSGTTFSVKTGYTTSGKNYKVAADSSGNLYVNVP